MIVLTAGYFDVDAASVLISVLKLTVACAPKEVNAAVAVVAPVPPFPIAKVPVTPVAKLIGATIAAVPYPCPIFQ